MQITRAADYALRGMTYLARMKQGEFCLIKDLSKHEGVPEKFMRKLVHILHKQGYISSRRGKNGGIQIGKSPDEITMLEIVEAVDGKMAINICLKGPEMCDRIELCNMCEIWSEAQSKLVKVLSRYSLSDIADSNGKLN